MLDSLLAISYRTLKTTRVQGEIDADLPSNTLKIALILHLSQIREYLPSRDFKAVVGVLHKMYNFMKMTALGTVSSSKGLKVTLNKNGCLKFRL